MQQEWPSRDTVAELVRVRFQHTAVAPWRRRGPRQTKGAGSWGRAGAPPERVRFGVPQYCAVQCITVGFGVPQYCAVGAQGYVQPMGQGRRLGGPVERSTHSTAARPCAHIHLASR